MGVAQRPLGSASALFTCHWNSLPSALRETKLEMGWQRGGDGHRETGSERDWHVQVTARDNEADCPRVPSSPIGIFPASMPSFCIRIVPVSF